MTLSASTVAAMATLAQFGGGPLTEVTVPEARTRPDRYRALQGPPPSIYCVEDVVLDTGGISIPGRWYLPSPAQVIDTVLVFFHGGGFVIGDLDVVDIPCRHLAMELGCAVLSVGYRRAPENPYPAAVHDAVAAVRWARTNAWQFGHPDQVRVITAGDSAGGNLAVAANLFLRDNGQPTADAQLLIYPMLEFAFDTESHRQYASGYGITNDALHWFWAHYLGARSISDAPYAEPGRARNLRGLPPTLIVLAEFDPLADQGRRFVEELTSSGCPATLELFAGLTHGFYWMLDAVPEGRRIFQVARTFLQASGIETSRASQ